MRPTIYILSIFLTLSLWNVASADTQLGGAGNDPIFFPFEDHCVINCYSNVLFLPGMMGSRLFEQSGVCLYATQEQERWVSIFDCNQERLALNEHGTSINPLYTKEGEI